VTVLAIDKWATNAALIADCARLGYLHADWRTLDPTYGYGTFWNDFRPAELDASDLDPAKSPIGYSVDFRALPWPDRYFGSVVFDGPYKLNGNPSDTDGSDERYGVHEYTDWRDRMALLRAGVAECARVLRTGGYLLVKCQDQVCGGRVRWQTFELTLEAEKHGLGLVDRLDFLSYRPQPNGRRQVHARRNASTMLVFKRGWWTSDLPQRASDNARPGGGGTPTPSGPIRTGDADG
jgi:hypothetical protein